MAILNDELYIGTTWGCIIIAERSSLRPITIFRPYEEEVRCIIPLTLCKRRSSGHDKAPLLATIGRGYRNLLTRYTDVGINATLQSPVVSCAVAVNTKQNMFVLLWRAEHWGAT